MLKEFIESIISYYKAGAPCLFHHVTGLYCPGCGGTRSLHFLFTGHFIRSFIYHPLVLYVAILALYIIIRHLTDFVKTKSFKLDRFYSKPWMAWMMLVIVVLNFIVKNTALLVYHIDLLQF
ncbi:MAG: DUF2752 domain-containing protein [Lachnospiraceae bacterium]|nr:DUF2752 domain-containing protein [Lachnospiraceae bacterium]